MRKSTQRSKSITTDRVFSRGPLAAASNSVLIVVCGGALRAFLSTGQPGKFYQHDRSRPLPLKPTHAQIDREASEWLPQLIDLAEARAAA